MFTVYLHHPLPNVQGPRSPSLHDGGKSQSPHTVAGTGWPAWGCCVPTEDLEGWCDVEHGGDGWRVEELPGDCGVEFIHDESVKKYFASSFE